MDSYITELPNNVKMIRKLLPISNFEDLIEFEIKMMDDPNFKLTTVRKRIVHMLEQNF